MREYTIGEVIDIMELDEVAIRVNEDSGFNVDGYVETRIGIHYDEDDNGKLKSLTGYEIAIYKNHEIKNDSKFVIMSREVYERVRGGKCEV